MPPAPPPRLPAPGGIPGGALALLLFLRDPEPGRVKSRLARGIGPVAACRLYREMARQAVRTARALPAPWAPVVLGTGAPPDAFTDWLGSGLPVREQAPGDLGERLRAAFHNAFDAGAGGVVAVGGDCPGLDADYLGQAAAALQEHDCVLGPARDGGYCLLGLAARADGIFRDIPWGTAAVLDTTRERCRESGRSVVLLSPLRDVDTEEDARALGLLPG